MQQADREICRKSRIKRKPSSIKEGDSETFEVPAPKRSCRRRKKETIDACNSILGGIKVPALDGIWLTLVNESTPARLANYVNTSIKMMTKVIPRVCKKPIYKDFENSLVKVCLAKSSTRLYI